MPLLLLFLSLAAPAPAATWLLDGGLAAGVGASRIVGDPSPDLGGPFAGSPKDGGASTGLTGSIGLAAGLARAGGLRLSAELGMAGADGVIDQTFHLGGGTDLRRVSRYSLSGPRLTLAGGWALPGARAGGVRLDPRVMLGGYYEHFTSRDLTLAADGGDPQAFPWDAPLDDAGVLAGLGLDLRDARPHQWFPRVALDLRWRRGHSSLDPARGVDAPLQAFEAVLTVPVMLHAW